MTSRTHGVDRILRDVAGTVGDALEAIEARRGAKRAVQIRFVAIDVRQLVEEIVVQRVHGRLPISARARSKSSSSERGGRFLDHRDRLGAHLEHALGRRELLDWDESRRCVRSVASA
jgi:hypothetical protein